MAATTKASFLPLLLLLFLCHAWWLKANAQTTYSSEQQNVQRHQQQQQYVYDRRRRSNSIPQQLPSGNHSANAAIIISSSRYWFNYRHVSNALEIYNIVKHHGGIPDENILLMLADDIPCNDRNPYKHSVYSHGWMHGSNLYSEDIEIDYRGDDVTVENLVRVLLGRHPPDEPPSRKLDVLSSSTNLLLYITGHGGAEFFKFQDMEEIMTQDLTSIFQQMHTMGRYNELLFVADTCQAFTLAPPAGSVPKLLSVASSLKDQSSYSHHTDIDIGLSVIDRWTNGLAEYLRKARYAMNDVSISGSMVESMTKRDLNFAEVGIRSDDFGRDPKKVPLCDFFCQKQPPQQTTKLHIDSFPLPPYDETTMPQQKQPQKQQTRPLECSNMNEPQQNATESDTPFMFPPFKDTNSLKRVRKGIQPTDPLFLLCVLILFVILRISSVVFK